METMVNTKKNTIGSELYCCDCDQNELYIGLVNIFVHTYRDLTITTTLGAFTVKQCFCIRFMKDENSILYEYLILLIHDIKYYETYFYSLRFIFSYIMLTKIDGMYSR